MYGQGGYALVPGRVDRPHGVGHGIKQVCKDQPQGPSSDGLAGEGSLPGAKVVLGEEGQLVVKIG